MSDQTELDKVQNLLERIESNLGLGENQDEGNEQRIRYVIYARKSTENKDKQERSIPQQIEECKELQRRLDLRVTGAPLYEQKSAKISENRPKFREMLDGIIKGKYDGILVWSPDRLARNMKEAGEIIDLLDRGIIKDLKFANNFVYSNDPAGKMLLGMAFVMSKQYSDQHSQDVSRSNKRKTLEGRYVGSHLKHGYYKDQNGYLRPDGKNWDLIHKAFQMRLRGEKLEDTASWLSKEGYPIKTRSNRKPVKITEDFVSSLCHDPFYAGVMIHGKNMANLLNEYDFQPMITAEEFDSLCPIDGIKKKYKAALAAKSKDGVKSELMRGMVTCADCGNLMSTGTTTKRTKDGVTRYFYFRCNTDGCERKNKSVRANVLIDAVKQFLREHPFNNRPAYDRYLKAMQKKIDTHKQELNDEIRSVKAQMKRVRERISDTKEMVNKSEDKDLEREFRKDLKIELQKSKELEEKKERNEQKLLNADEAIMSFEVFIELFGNLAERIQNLSEMPDLDFIIRKLFSNFLIKNKKVAQITQNSPFRELCVDASSAMVTPRRIELLFAG